MTLAPLAAAQFTPPPDAAPSLPPVGAPAEPQPESLFPALGLSMDWYPLLPPSDVNAPRLWASVEYAMLFATPNVIPAPLLTTGPPASGGIIGNPGTQVLLGGGQVIDYGIFSGVQFTTGGWFTDRRLLGSEGTTLFVAQNSATYTFGSDGSTVLARPFVNALTSANDARAIAFPGERAATFTLQSQLQFFDTDSNIIYNLYRDQFRYVNLLFGYRYFALDEQMLMTDTETVIGPGTTTFLGVPQPPGNVFQVTDRFQNVTRVFALQTGVRAEWIQGPWRFNMVAKIGAGWSHARLYADGRTTPLNPPAPAYPGGLLADPTYSYRSSLDQFTWIPEFQGRIAYAILPRMSVYAGIDYLFITNLARPGQQIDQVVNPTQVPMIGTGILVGPARPMVPKVNSTFTAEGLLFGMEFRY
ncbi:MAG TPA: BBP7 family outer membrane beta-barrel protein [Gemmataceae bacterium]|nr:BBP7 family outer membrane beta-barrel protein [Gemmataceae bacterium]